MITTTLREALLAAGQILKSGFSIRHRVRYKSPTSPVTQIDIQAERKIISLIRKRFPDHIFLAEESTFIPKNKKGKTGTADSLTRWIIDPLDGTVNFMHGIPQSSVSIAVERDGIVFAGGVYDPFRNELFLAERGKGASLNGRPIHVSKEKSLAQSLLITGFPYDHREKADLYLSVINPFLKRCMDIRRFGSAAIDLAWIACGRAAGYWEFNLSPWDMAAGCLLVEEAGGQVSDFRGRPIDIDHPKQTLATNGSIHRAMLNVFKTIL